MRYPLMSVGNGYKMTKEEIKDCLGKYVQLSFVLYSKRQNVESYFELYGHIIKVENKNILFKDNYSHQFIIEIARVKEAKIHKARRKPKTKTKK